MEDVKQVFERTETMILEQERFCRQIQAFLTRHEDEVKSVGPDVALVREKADAVEQVLASDAQAVERSRKVVQADGKDFARVQRVVENLKLPAGYQVPNTGLNFYSSAQITQTGLARPAEGDMADDAYDTDLIGHYFSPMATDLQSTLNTYASNLAEIESHMRVIESSAVGQAQQLAAKRAGISGGAPANGDDTVRELADTLRGFEEGIMGVAGVVGQCREGVNELVLGRLGETLGGSTRESMRRPW